MIKIILIALLSMILLVNAQTISLTNYREECINHTAYYEERIPLYTYKIIIHPNLTKENQSTYAGDDIILKEKVVTDCNKEVFINDKTINYKMQGYNCKPSGNIVICDNDINNGGKDGNGDGICQSGETCCKIENNIISCKNSQGWKTTGSVMPVDALGVR